MPPKNVKSAVSEHPAPPGDGKPLGKHPKASKPHSKQNQRNKGARKLAPPLPIKTHEPTTLYDGFMNKGSNAGSTVVSNEVALCITRYFDYQGVAAAEGPPVVAAASVYNFVFDQEQELLGSVAGPPGISGQGAVALKVRKCKVFVYPRSVNAANNESVYAVIASVPVKSGTVASTAAIPFNAHQQTTVVPPTFTPKWHKVLDVNYGKLFKDGTILPPGTDGTGLTLFQLAVINPDDGLPITDQAYQFKVVVDVSQAVATTNKVTAADGYGPSFGATPGSITLNGTIPCFIQVKGMSNVV